MCYQYSNHYTQCMDDIIICTVKPVCFVHRGTKIINCLDYRVLISQVHLYCNGTTTDCPYYRGLLILECPQ